MISDALFSPNKAHRLKLWRIWDITKPMVAFCMLNPSTANEIENDPTVERCQRRAKMMGFGSLVIVNIFSYRSTDPQELYKSLNILDISPFENDDTIIDVALKAKMFVCGWGKHGKLYGRGDAVLKMLNSRSIKTYALKINKDGSPAHPLYIGYNIVPKQLELS